MCCQQLVSLKIAKAANNFTVLHKHEFQLVRVKVDDLRPFRYIVCKLPAELKLQNNFNAEEIYEENKYLPKCSFQMLTLKNVYDCRRDAKGKHYERFAEQESKAADNFINID